MPFGKFLKSLFGGGKKKKSSSSSRVRPSSPPPVVNTAPPVVEKEEIEPTVEEKAKVEADFPVAVEEEQAETFQVEEPVQDEGTKPIQEEKEEEPAPSVEVAEEKPVEEKEAAAEPPEVQPSPIPPVVEEPVVEEKPIGERIFEEGKKYIGTPYLYGGVTPEGFDCSGFVGWVYEHVGIDLPRTSREQAELGERINVESAFLGDLIFFSHTGNRVNHVGIVVNAPGEPLTMIHASSSKGIIISDLAHNTYWKPRITHAVRILEENK